MILAGWTVPSFRRRGAGHSAPGAGAGIVVLKRLADAIADRDTIHAVIRGAAVNNRLRGRTPPGRHGRERRRRRAAGSGAPHRVPDAHLRLAERLQQLRPLGLGQAGDPERAAVHPHCLVIGERVHGAVSGALRVLDGALRVVGGGRLQVVVGNLGQPLAGGDRGIQLQHPGNGGVELQPAPARDRVIQSGLDEPVSEAAAVGVPGGGRTSRTRTASSSSSSSSTAGVPAAAANVPARKCRPITDATPSTSRPGG